MEDDLMGLGRFFAQAARLPLLTARQERELAQQRDAGDFRAEQKLVEHNIRLAIHHAKRYRNKGVEFEDLVQEAIIGLHRAAKKFRWQKGFKFSTYATWWCTHMLQRAVLNKSHTIKTPGGLVQRHAKIREVQQRLPHATYEELAHELDCDVSEIKEALYMTRVVGSLDAPTLIDDGATQYDLIADPDAVIPDDVFVKDDRLVKALLELTPRQRSVIELRCGLFRERALSRKETADELGVSAGVVSQDLRAAKLELKRLLGVDEGGEPTDTVSSDGGVGVDCVREEPAPC